MTRGMPIAESQMAAMPLSNRVNRDGEMEAQLENAGLCVSRDSSLVPARVSYLLTCNWHGAWDAVRGTALLTFVYIVLMVTYIMRGG